MWSLFWNVIKPHLLTFWKPLAWIGSGLLALAYRDWLKRKIAAQKEEISGLRTKEKILERHDAIEEKADEIKKRVDEATTLDDLDRLERERLRRL